MRRLGQVVTVLVMLVVSAGLIHAAGSDAQKCAASKLKAASKKISAELKCISKAVSKGEPVDGNCLSKADTKFDSAVGKADTKGGCALTGDGPTLKKLLDADANAINAFTPVTRFSCCQDAFGLCWYEADPNVTNCSGFTIGAANSVCDGSGACVPEPASPGLSCNNPTLYGVPPANSRCLTGPENGLGGCETGLGTSDPNSLCPPNGGNSVGF